MKDFGTVVAAGGSRAPKVPTEQVAAGSGEPQVPELTALSTAEIQLGNVTLKVAVLDNGQRVILEESMIELLARMEDGTWDLKPGDAAEFAQWMRAK